MSLLILTIFIFLIYLIYERILINRWQKSIPMRICVTGTRGKSSVVRMLASVLREDGRNLLAKTTGAEAKYILPDGDEIEVSRRRITTIIEQKRLLKKAAALNADCIVAEIMSLQPENHYIETQQILKPNIVVITNVRLDHIDAMGGTKDEIASVLSLAISKQAIVFVPDTENRAIFQTTAENVGGELISVGKGFSSSLQKTHLKLDRLEFDDNIDITYAIAKYLNIDDKIIATGFYNTRHDIGQLKVWKYAIEDTKKICYFANGFAANDPQSTMQVILKIKEKFPSSAKKFIGLLNLRPDRADRTLQWIEALNNGACNYFSRVFVLGVHSKIVKRKVKWVNILKEKSPEKMMKSILNEAADQSMIFGFGNMGGAGKIFVEYWKRIGEEYGV
ncbi:MAG: poly-gamma-glutamate synthase PgsB [bacterium]|nr:MAG: poly-gamma-glutamate synthase PgsB [bacterium]